MSDGRVIIEFKHLTLDDQHRQLSRAIGLLKKESNELHDAIVDALTFKQYWRWDNTPENLSAVTKNSKLLVKAKRIIDIWKDITELKGRHEIVLRQFDARAELQLVENKTYSWYELRVREINKQANTRNNSTNQAGLRLVD